ncbi:hypothetical protein G6F56_001572 [Rhizopus delemar]|nr:hypothetical protein G6F56_001572 [Rhizopus delemar]
MNRKKSASIMWPGSNTRYNTPDYIVPVSKSMKVKEQIQTVVEWLDLPYNTRPQMISVHVPQMEEKSHKEKPDSPKMDEHIKEVDDAIGYLTKEIFSRNLDPHAHIVIVSDHGMVSTSKYKLIYIDDILPHHLLEYVKNASPSSVLHFRPNISSNVVQEIYQQLIHHTKTSHFKVYLRENMPIRYHYKHSDRISPIQAIPNIGYQFVTHSMEFNEGGDHEGYDNLADAMGSIFLARGPKVSKIYKPGTVLEPFVNVEVYGFMTELLNINAAPNNGTVGTKFPILYEPPFPPK